MGEIKLGISNLAWDNTNNIKIFEILKDNNINYIEIVLPKFLIWNNLELKNVLSFIEEAYKYKLYVLSTQSIMFNSNIDNFHTKDFLMHIEKVSKICFELGINKIVLGAPTLRKLNKDFDLIKNFHYINKVLEDNKQILLIEPNSKIYGGNYFYTIEEISTMLYENKFSNISSMIDIHNSLLEGEDPSTQLQIYQNIIQHIHVSEIGLGDFIESTTHNNMAKSIKHINYNNLVIYESKPSTNLIKSIKSFNKIYNI